MSEMQAGRRPALKFLMIQRYCSTKAIMLGIIRHVNQVRCWSAFVRQLTPLQGRISGGGKGNLWAGSVAAGGIYLWEGVYFPR